MARDTIPLLYEDDEVIAVLKPAGLAVHHSQTVGPQESVLLQLLRQQIGQRLYPVH